MSFVQIKKYLQKNLYYVFAFSFFIGLFSYILINEFNRNKYFTEGKTLYTVATVYDYLSQGKGGRSVEFSFYYNNEYFVSSNDQGDAVKNSIYFGSAYETGKMRKLLKGKNFFVKFSVERPKYCQIYLSKPIAEDFQYVEGQTWKAIPKGAVENKDIYGNYR
jgi:hypothetical protein